MVNVIFSNYIVGSANVGLASADGGRQFIAIGKNVLSVAESVIGQCFSVVFLLVAVGGDGEASAGDYRELAFGAASIGIRNGNDVIAGGKPGEGGAVVVVTLLSDFTDGEGVGGGTAALYRQFRFGRDGTIDALVGYDNIRQSYRFRNIIIHCSSGTVVAKVGDRDGDLECALVGIFGLTDYLNTFGLSIDQIFG